MACWRRDAELCNVWFHLLRDVPPISVAPRDHFGTIFRTPRGSKHSFHGNISETHTDKRIGAAALVWWRMKPPGLRGFSQLRRTAIRQCQRYSRGGMDKSQFFFMLFPIVCRDIKQESYLVSTNAASARVQLLPASHTRTRAHTHARTRISGGNTNGQTDVALQMCAYWFGPYVSNQFRVTITDSLIWHQSPGQAWKGETETLCFDVFFSITLQIISHHSLNL